MKRLLRLRCAHGSCFLNGPGVAMSSEAAWAPARYETSVPKPTVRCRGPSVIDTKPQVSNIPFMATSQGPGNSPISNLSAPPSHNSLRGVCYTSDRLRLRAWVCTPRGGADSHEVLRAPEGELRTGCSFETCGEVRARRFAVDGARTIASETGVSGLFHPERCTPALPFEGKRGS